MSVYRIDLVPLERFFFGGENTFGENNSQNYYVRSNHFPQQTTLLGTLRYLLLKRKNLMGENGKIIEGEEVEASKLIGETSFSISNFNAGYGKIKRLYPVFISGPDGDFVMQSREFGLNWVEDEITGKQTQGILPMRYRPKKGCSKLAADKNFISYLDGLNAKTIFPELLLNISNRQVRYLNFSNSLKGNPMNGIFVEEEQVGINKKEKEKGYYKQLGYRLLDGYGFSFYAEIEEDIAPFEKLPIKMGADQSWFSVSITRKVKNEPAFELFSNSKPANFFRFPNSPSSKIVLLSDTYMERSLYDDADDSVNFALAETYTFRFLQTIRHQSVGSYKNEKAHFYMDKSTGFFELLKKGSVLFVDSNKKTEILKIIEGSNNTAAAFHQIGYNYAI